MKEEIVPIYQKSLDLGECQILGGIDTLYFFVEILSDFSARLYHKTWSSVLDGSFNRDGYSFLNFSGKKTGFIGGWYTYTGRDNIPLFKIGFKDPLKQQQVKNVYVQLLGSGIYSLGFLGLMEYVKIELSDLLGEDVSNDSIYPSRADLNAFVYGFDFGDIDADMFKTNFRKNLPIRDEKLQFIDIDKSYEYKNRRALETLYLGDHRNAPLYMKIYNKLVELDKKKHEISSLIKRDFLITHGPETSHIWNIEFSIKREVLKQYSIFTYTNLLELAGSVFVDLMKRNAFLGYDLEIINNYRVNNNLNKLPIHEIWQKIIDNYDFCNYYIDVERVYKDHKKGSRNYSLETISREIKRQIQYKQPLTSLELSQLITYNEGLICPA